MGPASSDPYLPIRYEARADPLDEFLEVTMGSLPALSDHSIHGCSCLIINTILPNPPTQGEIRDPIIEL